MKGIRTALALFLVVVMTASAFTACGSGNGGEETSALSADETLSGEAESSGEEASSGEEGSSQEVITGLCAEKTGSTDYTVYINENGVYYTDDNGKYGIMSFDGKSDTGPVYDFCAPEGKYFTVVEAIPQEAMQPSELNCKALVDINGEEIIPPEYASFSVLNERYIRVYRILGLTGDESEALLDFTDGSFSLTFADGNQLYKGEWEIFDLEKGCIVEGISGTKPSTVMAYGNYIKYTDDDGKQYILNSDGKELPTGAVLFDNGCYTVLDKKKTILYDTDDNELFTAGKKDHHPISSEGEYFLAEKKENSDDKYVYLDKEGNPVSGYFSSCPDFHGDYTVINGKIYNFAGELVFEEEYKQVYYDSIFGRGYFLRNEDEYTLVAKDGSIIAEFTDTDAISISPLGFVVTRREDDGTRHYYSVKEEDYILTGYILDSWLVEKEVSSDIFEVVDVYTGEAIISGYSDYITIAAENNSMYVYAKTQDGIYDIYTVS